MAYEGMFAETVRMQGHQGDQIDAYLARPLGSGPFPGIVVIHHMPGCDEATKEITRKFAHHGYAAIMPDLHSVALALACLPWVVLSCCPFVLGLACHTIFSHPSLIIMVRQALALSIFI